MTQQGGDRKYGHADELTVEYNDGTDGEPGDAVYVNGESSTHPQVVLSTDGDPVHGVLGEVATQGDYVDVTFHGAAWARVADGDNVSAGDTVGVDTGMTAGELTSSGTDVPVVSGEATDNETSKKVALVLLGH